MLPKVCDGRNQPTGTSGHKVRVPARLFLQGQRLLRVATRLLWIYLNVTRAMRRCVAASRDRNAEISSGTAKKQSHAKEIILDGIYNCLRAQGSAKSTSDLQALLRDAHLIGVDFHVPIVHSLLFQRNPCSLCKGAEPCAEKRYCRWVSLFFFRTSLYGGLPCTGLPRWIP